MAPIIFMNAKEFMMKDINNLRKENELIDLFCTLAQIPSPSGEEEKVSQKIVEILNNAGINAKHDDFGNVRAKLPATDNSKKPIALSAHMDVVGDNSAVNIKISEDGMFIETDKNRPLGSDDKVGVSAAMYLAIYLIKHPEIKHGGLELIFTKDEEQNMSGIHNVKFNEIDSEYVLVLDADKLGQIQISGASYTNGTLTVESLKGGHSGIDIGDKTRLNAVKLIGELINEIPQGEYKRDDYGTVTSINIGCVIGGGVEPTIQKIVQKGQEQDSYIEYVANNCLTNIINTKAMAKYSIRSSEEANENQLINDIKEIVNRFNEKYVGLAKAEFVAKSKMKAFEKSEDETIQNICVNACENIGIKGDVSSFHAGAETHIYAHEKNKHGKTLKPYLLGVADIYNMHSSNEMVNIESFKKGYEFLKESFLLFNK